MFLFWIHPPPFAPITHKSPKPPSVLDTGCMPARGCEQEAPRSLARSCTPLTLSGQGISWRVSYKEGSPVREVIILPHFLTWPCVTWMPLYPHFGYCYFSLIKNKWGWSVFTYPTISGCSYTVLQNGFWPSSLKLKRSLAGVHTSDFHRLLVQSCPST